MELPDAPKSGSHRPVGLRQGCKPLLPVPRAHLWATGGFFGGWLMPTEVCSPVNKMKRSAPAPNAPSLKTANPKHAHPSAGQGPCVIGAGGFAYYWEPEPLSQ
jgi:hypothetical protein